MPDAQAQLAKKESNQESTHRNKPKLSHEQPAATRIHTRNHEALSQSTKTKLHQTSTLKRTEKKDKRKR
jgi:hypothetical protein